MTSHFIEKIGEIAFLVLEWEKHVVLQKCIDGAVFCGHLYSHRINKRGSLKLFNLACHCCGKEVRVTLLGDYFEDFFNFWSKVKIQKTISLVQNLKERELQVSDLVISNDDTRYKKLARYFKVFKWNPFVFSKWSTSLPGVAMTMCGRFDSAMACVIMSIPPTITAHFNPILEPRASNCSEI